MNPLLNVIQQSFALSFAELRGAKLRSFLSLTGITIGILCIISVQTAVSSLETNIRDSFSKFGNDVFYVQKWPWEFSDNYTWWKYINRPTVTVEEMEVLEKRLKLADALAIIYFAGDYEAEYLGRVTSGATVKGVSNQYDKIKSFEFQSGRYFTPLEFQNGSSCCILGANVADALSEGLGDISGKTIKIKGKKYTVTGILKREGDDLFGFSLDNNLVIPYKNVSNLTDINSNGDDPLIAITSKTGIPADELKYEISGTMRAIRKLPPDKENNFAINKISVFTEGITAYLGIVNLAGWFIGLLSMLVGGFGIANIMFVSVKERTYIIGLKKAIGAHQIYILLEFLLESVILCLLGGIIGLLLVFLIFKLLSYAIADSGFVFHLTFKNMFMGIAISVFIGILAGFIPAWTASKMKPVDALRY